MFARIEGLGRWLPERVRINAEWPDDFSSPKSQPSDDRTLVDVRLTDEHAELRRIVGRYLEAERGDPFLGTRRRRVADDAVSAVEAETWAARAALADAGVEAAEVDVILSWALVPDRVMPSGACAVGHALGARRAWSSTADAACASPVVQLTLAAALIESGRAKKVLLTQSHLATRTFSLGHPASPCVGDGATAMVVGASEHRGVGLAHSVTHGEHADAVIWCRHRNPEEDPVWWQAGGPQVMSSHAPEVARALIQNTVPTAVQTVHELCNLSKLEVESIDVLACVQPRGWVPLALAEGLGLPTERAPETYRDVAHLGGAGPVMNLIEARSRGLLRPGAQVVMYAQGAGFTRGAVHLMW